MFSDVSILRDANHLDGTRCVHHGPAKLIEGLKQVTSAGTMGPNAVKSGMDHFGYRVNDVDFRRQRFLPACERFESAVCWKDLRQAMLLAADAVACLAKREWVRLHVLAFLGAFSCQSLPILQCRAATITLRQLVFNVAERCAGDWSRECVRTAC